MGAKYVLNSTDEDFIKKLTELTAKLETKWCYDAIGGSFTGKILSALPSGSTVAVYGLLSNDPLAKEVRIEDLLFKEKTVQGFWLTSWFKKVSPQEGSKAMQSMSKLINGSLKSSIAKEFPLENLKEALEFYENNMSAGKVIIRPWGSE